MKNSKSYEFLFLIAVSILIIVSRLVYKASFLYEWDSVQYALSINRFDILWHQPHPPGYIFYVLLIKGASFLVHDANSAIIYTNILISLVVILSFYFLCRSFFSDRKLAAASTLILAFNPIFWFYGSTATIYTADALIAVLVGWSAWKTLRGECSLPLFSLILGLSGGIRQTSLILLFPIWFYVLWRNKPPVREIIRTLLVLGLSVLLWLIPTIVNTGGLENYLAISRGLSSSGAEKVKLIFGTTGAYIHSNGLNLLVWLMEAINPFGFLIILFAIGRKMKISPFWALIKNEKVLFWALWVLPSVLLYSTYIEKSGYLLSVVPQFCILTGWAINQIIKKSKAAPQRDTLLFTSTTIIVLMMIIWFVVPASENGVPVKIERSAGVIEPPLSNYNWDVSNREITLKETTWQEMEDILVSDADITAENTVIFWFGGYPTWRHFSYYYPEYLNIWLFDPTLSGVAGYYDYYYAQDGKVGSASGFPFYYSASQDRPVTVSLPAGIRHIIWTGGTNTDIYQGIIETTQIDGNFQLVNGQQVLISSIGSTSIDLGSFIIKTVQE